VIANRFPLASHTILFRYRQLDSVAPFQLTKFRAIPGTFIST
jgi:hypothetical protein